MIIKNTINALKTSWKGLSLTLRHLFSIGKRRKSIDIKSDNYFEQQKGLVTVQFPKEKLPVPEVGRYQLHVEIDDCIVCDLCAKICPVDCIEIESIKATGPIGQTSDGTTKRLYPAKFDIDMAKCLYCGLCTVVCPTECITMTDQYDKSVTNIADLTYKFSDMTPAEAEEKRQELAKQVAEKQAAKEAATKAAAPKDNPNKGEA
ncbi:NuoI/complex I 23 kDa subunit family protein [Arcticibacter tournemirensis]|uniref:NADH-quinone oxidoreductase subunit I n=1 Tax=Arcticibacter tournemirensis TaxID=699437 RepID=A0A4Q0M368_9SPHI|nr:NADH-quinone oxidoreductase subunit I [Arcticibacter tournemirensis]RXF67006.1 NADH-quinone oxidoreductase subunit I [Arcticibacter tournemirensis]